MSFPLSNEALKDRLDLCMGMAVSMIKEFAYLLIEVADGKRSVDSIVQLFGMGQVEQ